MRDFKRRLAFQRKGTDCVRCALATLLGLSYRAVPDFWKRYRTPHTQLAAVEKWLNKRGFVMIFMDSRRRPDCFYLAEGMASTTDGFVGGHMVVMRKGKIVHDPGHQSVSFRPSRCWLVIPKDVGKRPASPGKW